MVVSIQPFSNLFRLAYTECLLEGLAIFTKEQYFLLFTANPFDEL